MKLTWNQRRALENLGRFPDGASPREIADLPVGIHPWLCGASARSAVMALVRKGLAECHDTRSPLRYRITPAGRAALEKEKQA